MRTFGYLLIWFSVAGAAWASEPQHGCFRSPAEAVLGNVLGNPSIAQNAMEGTRGGFRVEGVRRDAVLGKSWATVRNCEHPERPAVVVEMLRAAGAALPARAAVETVRTEAPVLMAGARVEVIRVEGSVRLSMNAVAERSAAVGQRLRLRVIREAGEDEQFVEGVVRGAGLVEMDGAR